MTAPIAAKAMAVRSEANTNGAERGSLSRRNVCHREARIDAISSSSSSVDCKPVTVFTNTGKKQMTAAMRIFGMAPNPNQITNRGAMAILGVEFRAMV